MPTYKEDLNQIKQLREQARKANEASSSLSASGATFRDDIMKRVRAKRAERGFNVLASDTGQTTGQLVTANPELRARVGTELNPLMTDVLTSQQRGQILDTLATIANLQKENTGTVEDIIGAGTNRLKAMAILKAAEAQKVASEANDLLNQVQMEEAKAREAFNESLALKKFGLEKARFNREGSGGSTRYQLAPLGNDVYTFNPRTGALKKNEDISQNLRAEAEQKIAEYANAVADDRMKITAVPAEIRGQVSQLSSQIKSQSNIFNKIKNWFGSWFK